MLYGRQKIYTTYREVTDENVGTILAEAYVKFLVNLQDINFLFDYYKGMQPILQREKKIRPEINNKIVENHAYSIVQFKTGYLLEKPIQYVARKDNTNIVALSTLNDFMEIESKQSKDKQIANDRAVCGTSYRLVLTNKNYDKTNLEQAPFNIFTIAPQQAFVVYSSDIGEKALLGVIILVEKVNNQDVIKLQAYTEDKFYVFNYTLLKLESVTSHTYGMIPLIEYPNNDQRLGAFEVVITLLDAINNIQSNRLDAIEQFVQAIMVFKNVEISKEMLDALKEMGAIQISDSGEVKANVEYLQQELNQDQVQKLKDDLLEVVYKICGIPNNHGSGGGDTGVATIVRDGWSEAEAKTQEDELSFKASEKQFLRLALSITKTLTFNSVALSVADIDIKFTRRNYENLTQKVNALVLMLQNGKVAPRLAFSTCGLFADPEEAYRESDQYVKEQTAGEEENA